MNEFINKHPVLTTGIIFGLYRTTITVVGLLKGTPMPKTRIIVLSEKPKEEESNPETKQGE